MQKDGRTKTRHAKLITLVVAILLIATLASSGMFVYFYATDYGVRPKITGRAQNIILLVGSGMGENHIIAAEMFGATVFGRFGHKGKIETRSFNLFPTDSAAAASAMATGQKTFNGRISYLNGENLTNFGQIAKEQGKKVGVISTASVTGATPAAFTTHAKSHTNHSQIAIEQINTSDLDILFGFGKEYFDPHAAQINTAQRGYYDSYQSLMAGEKEQAFALFEESIPLEGAFTLSSLTSKALMMLENEAGFFLLVESTGIDKHSRQNDMDGMLEEFWGFNDAVKVALDYASIPGSDTTVIVLSNHETGKLILPEDTLADQISSADFHSSGNTARDVPYFIKGAGAEEIPSTIDNTDIFFILKQLFGG